jgi:hypothetical protein
LGVQRGGKGVRRRGLRESAADAEIRLRTPGIIQREWRGGLPSAGGAYDLLWSLVSSDGKK